MSTTPTNNNTNQHLTSSSISSALNPNHFEGYDDEGEVHVLLLRLSQIAKQRLEQGEQKLMQAKKRDQEYIDFCKRYTATQQKLSIIFAEIHKQLGVIKRLVLSLGAKNRTLLGEIEKIRQYQEQCIDELKVVLDLLEQKPLHPKLIAAASNASVTSNMSTSSSVTQEKKTLFDFVNIESVTDLQQRAENELLEMRNIESLGTTIMQEVDEQFRDISQSSSKLFESNEEALSLQQDSALPPPLSPRSKRSHESVTQQQTMVMDVALNNIEIKAMGNIVLEIAGHYDRLKHVLSNPVFSSTIDTEEMEEKTNGLDALIVQLDTLLNRVNTNCTYIQSRYKRFSDFYRSAVSCYQELEKMAPNIPSKVVQIDELQTVFHQRRINSDVIFEEIRDLTLWYTLFQTSYDKLLYEIDRRRRVHVNHQRLVDSYKQELNKMYEQEELERQQFFEDYGKYLPVSLCPSIMERPTKYMISPENYQTNLPDIVMLPQLNEEAHARIPLQLTDSMSDSKPQHGESGSHHDSNNST